MEKNTLNILLLNNIEDDILKITKELCETMDVPFAITHLSDVKTSLNFLKKKNHNMAIVLLDSDFVCKGQCPENVCNLVEFISSDIPVVVVTGKEEHDLALFAIKAGASDNISRSDFIGTYGNLRDAIEISIARFSALKLIEKEKHNSDVIIDQLISYIGGGYACSSPGDNCIVKHTAPCGHSYNIIEEKHDVMYANFSR